MTCFDVHLTESGNLIGWPRQIIEIGHAFEKIFVYFRLPMGGLQAGSFDHGLFIQIKKNMNKNKLWFWNGFVSGIYENVWMAL